MSLECTTHKKNIIQVRLACGSCLVFLPSQSLFCPRSVSIWVYGFPDTSLVTGTPCAMPNGHFYTFASLGHAEALGIIHSFLLSFFFFFWNWHLLGWQLLGMSHLQALPSLDSCSSTLSIPLLLTGHTFAFAPKEVHPLLPTSKCRKPSRFGPGLFPLNFQSL